MTMADQIDDLPPIQISFFGSAGVGKTKIVNGLKEQEYNQKYVPSGSLSYSNLTQDGLIYKLVDTSGQDRLEAMIPGVIARSDINVICIDKSDRDSFEKAKEHAESINKHIAENNSNAQIIIAITQIDKAIVSAVTNAEIQQFKRDYGIKKEPIYTSAKTDAGISDLHNSIVESGKQLNAKKTGVARARPDTIFLNAFKSSYLNHLANADTKELSTIFNSLNLPINDKEKFEENRANAGSIMAYMRPTLNSVANLLLNKNKTALHDDVIKAIGKDKYTALVSGVKEGKDFAQKEAEVAKIVLSSVILNYSRSLENYTLSAKDLLEQITKLKDRVKNSEDIDDIQVTNLDELNTKIKDMTSKIDNALSAEDAAQLPTLLSEAEALKRAANTFYQPKNQELSQNVLLPLGKMVTQFNMTMLDEPKGALPSLAQVDKKIVIFLEMAKAAQVELQDKSNPSSFEAVNILVEKLDKARFAYNEFPQASDNTKRDFMLNAYNDAAEHFVKNINEDVLKTNPPESIMNILFRLVRAIFIGSTHTPEELKAQKHIEQQTNIKDELKAIKGNLPTEEKIESVEHRRNKI
jgi:GTPase SAR1 family protein